MVTGQVLELTKVQEMHTELRSGDSSLIRLEPTEETAEAQNDICPFMISSLVDTVEKADDLLLRGEAAEVLALCTTNNPANRADIGEAGRGVVFDALDDLVVKSMEQWNSTRAMEKEKQRALREKSGKVLAQAAEAVWILSFNNENNQKGFFQAGIIDDFIMAIRNCPVMFNRDFHCSEAVMWSLAALSNMAASYCTSHNGVCEWERDNNKNLALPEGVRQTSKIDNDVRERLMDHMDKQGFFKLLGYLVDGGPVTSPHDETYSWPSKGKDIHSEEHPEIVPWAAAALVRNLALSPDARQFFAKQTEEHGKLFVALCDLYKRSPDAYEEEMSYDALYRLGWEEHCPGTYDRCKDREGWVGAKTGNTCRDFEYNKLCATMGNELGKDVGITADDACCICGGGIPKTEDEMKKQEIEKKADSEFKKLFEL